MAHSKPFKCFSLLVIFALLHYTSAAVFAQDEDQELAGRVFDADHVTPLDDVVVRIVQAETGQSRDTKTNENGCYDFDELAVGTYTLSIDQGGLIYTLPNKIKVEPDTNLMACVGVAASNALEIITENCSCKNLVGLFLVLGSAAAVGFLLPAEEEPDEASPSRP